MWAAFVGWVGKLFSGKSALQIGKDQQAVSGTTSGSNSPMMAAGRDIHYTPPASPAPTQAERDAQLFSEMHELMPEILDAIREVLAEDPLLRTMVVFESSTIAYSCPEPHLLFGNDTHPDAVRKFAILDSHGLVRMRRRGFYELSNRLVRMLKYNL